MRYLVVLALLLAGCSSYELEPEWRPLRTIQESQLLTLGLSNGGARTINRTVYVRDLDKWFKRYPEPLFTAVMRHEQVHSRRQRDRGVSEWISRYLVDTDFMWMEESLGWYEQLRWLKQQGQQIVPEVLAQTLHSYRNIRGAMIGYQEALQWVNDVWSGHWSPPPE